MNHSAPHSYSITLPNYFMCDQQIILRAGHWIADLACTITQSQCATMASVGWPSPSVFVSLDGQSQTPARSLESRGGPWNCPHWIIGANLTLFNGAMPGRKGKTFRHSSSPKEVDRLSVRQIISRCIAPSAPTEYPIGTPFPPFWDGCSC